MLHAACCYPDYRSSIKLCQYPQSTNLKQKALGSRPGTARGALDISKQSGILNGPSPQSTDCRSNPAVIA